MSSNLSRAVLPAAVAIAVLSFISALLTGPVRTARAVEGDVCQVYTNAPSAADFDGQGNTIHLVNRGETYGIVFRIEDDQGLNLVIAPELTVIEAAAEETAEAESTETTEEEDSEAQETSEEETSETTEETTEEETSEATEEETPEATEAEVQEIDLDPDLTGENTQVRVDSETGSARITSVAEILALEEQERELPDGSGEALLAVPNVGHTLIDPGVLSQAVDTISPRFFNNSDGNPLDDIGEWLLESGYQDFVGDEGDDPDVCGDDTDSGTLPDCVEEQEGDCDFTQYFDDSWGFVDFECIEAGYFSIDIEAPDDTEETGKTLKFFCGGQAETASISANPETVETHPVGTSKSSSIITVSVDDQFGNRIDGVEVTFLTDNCRFSNPLADDPDDFGISPAGGGTTVTVLTDTDSTADDNFLTDNPLEHAAGTAEVSLDCATGTPGIAHVRAIVQRPGSDIVLDQAVKVVGPTAASGLILALTPAKLECGETVKATVKAVDATGAPVSDGTTIFFTTDTSSAIIGGVEGAQGEVTTLNGDATALIATDPGNPGVHTVIAYAMGPAGLPSAQVSQNYECEGAVAPVAPPTEIITPPSTGDAGLASGDSGPGLHGFTAVAAFVLILLARVCSDRRRLGIAVRR